VACGFGGAVPEALVASVVDCSTVSSISTVKGRKPHTKLRNTDGLRESFSSAYLGRAKFTVGT
jgi:hypothetical protein